MKKSKFKIRLARDVDVRTMPDRILLANLYVTQLVIVTAALVIIMLTHRQNPFFFFSWPDPTVWAWGGACALAALLLNVIVVRTVPGHMLDDGGVNEKLFRQRSYLHIIFLCAVVAVCEELLFRGAIQPILGNYWTSVLFAAIHVRYYRHWLLLGSVFLLSFALGWTMDHTGSIWSAIFAHFVIDLVLGIYIKRQGGS